MVLKDLKVYLIGMPGSGKSTFGNALAQQLAYTFVDLDASIEEKEQASIPEIFAHKGEAYFRIVERECLLETASLEQTVIATGGGAPCFYNNIQFIKEQGVSIFLNTSIEELAKRVSQQQGQRPLLPQQEKEELMEELQKKYALRLPYYQQAQFSLNEAEQSVEAVLKLLGR
ncbi:shikimate kinase [Rapidithrix thailandica]|uniref:Shikimate kinase n=1 Tax=Rapidithrix thailandica TaxID=413964 RepID=A0AAW9RV06_9BACT